MDLPQFKYHPDPIGTGSVEASETPCLSCNKIRGYVYTGPAYSEKFHYLSGCLCPWCIADGSAAKQFGATFTDSATIDIPDNVREELAQRTPGFDAWQQEQWLDCCGDAAAFLGLAGKSELKSELKDASEAVRTCLEEDYDLSGDDLEEFMNGLSKKDQPTAYIFRCLHCKTHLAYVDQT